MLSHFSEKRLTQDISIYGHYVIRVGFHISMIYVKTSFKRNILVYVESLVLISIIVLQTAIQIYSTREILIINKM